MKEPHKNQALFKDLTIGSYIRKRLTKDTDMLMIDSIKNETVGVRLWHENRPLKRGFKLTKYQVDNGDYIFIQRVFQDKLKLGGI